MDTDEYGWRLSGLDRTGANLAGASSNMIQIAISTHALSEHAHAHTLLLRPP